MTRPKKHNLNRYATPLDHQITDCKELAPDLLAAIKSPSKTTIAQALNRSGEFAFKVAGEFQWAAQTCRERAIVNQLEWMNAMTNVLDGLRSSESRKSPISSSIAETAFTLGYNFHAIPTWFRRSSILEEMAATVSDFITWRHLQVLLAAIYQIPTMPAVVIIPFIAEAFNEEHKEDYRWTNFDPNQIISVPRTSEIYEGIGRNSESCKLFLELTKNRLTKKELEKQFQARRKLEWQIANRGMSLLGMKFSVQW